MVYFIVGSILGMLVYHFLLRKVMEARFADDGTETVITGYREPDYIWNR